MMNCRDAIASKKETKLTVNKDKPVNWELKCATYP